MLKTCGHHFRAWARALNLINDPCAVRRVQEGHIWRNDAAVAMGLPRWTNWEELTAAMDPERAAALGDSHEIVLERGVMRYAGEFPQPLEGGGSVLCDVFHHASVCVHCELKCALVIASLTPVQVCADVRAGSGAPSR